MMNFLEEFPVLARYTYLNTANSGILSKTLMDWRAHHDKEFANKGSIFRADKDVFLDAGRKTIAEHYHADPGRTYLVQNFSRGFNTLLAGLDGPKRILLIREDYPSVNFPAESLGHQCEYVLADEHLETRITEAVGRFEPEVLALSLVQYTNGLKINLEFLKQLKAGRPDLLIIADGTQFCGMAGFDFDASGIDALISSGYKWLLGGYGNGFALLSALAAEQLYKRERDFRLPGEGFLKGRDTLSLFFEPGHLDTLSFGTLFQAIRIQTGLGAANLEQKTARLSAQARQAFISRGLLTQAVVLRDEHSAIFNLILPEAKILRLQEHDVIFSSRGAGIRVSFHFYNTENDLDKLLNIIDG